ncbi:MAG: TonB family protein [Polyangiaceae bacterium]
MRRAVVFSISIAALFVAMTAHAQKASDVGEAPAHARVTKMPKLKHFVEATYPAQKKANGEEGSVILTIEISATGDVTNVSVAQSAGKDFDDAAVAAAKQFDFEPAEVDDKPAPSKITYRYTFTIAVEPPAPPPAPTATATSAALPPPPPLPNGKIDEVTVHAPAQRARETSDVKVSANEARRVAGTQGDVLKVVQNLPGVARPPLASGQLVVWGSAPSDTHVYVDGVEIPAIYHGSGLRSVINSDLVSSVDLVPGGFNAEYGRSLGGLVRVETRELDRTGVHGYVGADTLDASAMVSAAVNDRARVAVAGRYSYLDSLLSAVDAPDIGDFFPIPKYRDVQLKATLDLRKGETLDIVALGSRDDLTRTVPSSDPAQTKSDASHTGFTRLYLRYRSVDASGNVVIATPFVGYDYDNETTSFGGTPTYLYDGAIKYGVRTSYRTKLAPRAVIELGLDALGSSDDISRSGSLTLPPREGDIAVFGQSPGDAVSADTWSTHILNVGPNAIAEIELGPLTVTPGVRIDTFLIEGSRQTPRVGLTPSVGFSRLNAAIDPRLALRLKVAPRVSLFASGGLYHQAPDPRDLSAVFGTPALGLSNATHVSAGQTVKITRTLDLEMTAFYKKMGDLTVRSRLTDPMLAQSLVQDGEGRSYGVQFLLRQEVWKGFFGWLSYTLSRSERRYVGDADWRLFDFDQPHVLALVASQEIQKWTIGARFRLSSGYPRTPVVGAYYDAHGDDYQPIFGAQNTLRIPAFYQLDLKIERVFPLGRAAKIVAFVDVENVTFHKNDEEIVYSSDYTQRNFITGLPTLAVVGARFEF